MIEETGQIQSAVSICQFLFSGLTLYFSLLSAERERERERFIRNNLLSEAAARCPTVTAADQERERERERGRVSFIRKQCP